MAFSKTQLLNSIRNDLRELGYFEVKKNIYGVQGLYVKKVRSEYYLILGITISRYNSFSFTASFYLSKSTRLGSVWGDIPTDSYKRIGHFLTREERLALLDEEHNREGVVDAWWDSMNELSVFHFIEAIRITESRFLQQEGLFKKIEDSKEVKKFSHDAKTVLLRISSNFFDNSTYEFIPQKQKTPIPIEWFMAAEETLRLGNGLINAKLVELLATDAWIQSMIDEKTHDGG